MTSMDMGKKFLWLTKLPALWDIATDKTTTLCGVSRSPQHRKDPTKETAHPSTRLSVDEELLANIEERAQVLLLAFDPDRFPGVTVDVSAELAIQGDDFLLQGGQGSDGDWDVVLHIGGD